MMGNPVPSLVKCKVSDVRFDNVLLNGEPVKSSADIPLRSESVDMQKVKYAH